MPLTRSPQVGSGYTGVDRPCPRHIGGETLGRLQQPFWSTGHCLQPETKPITIDPPLFLFLLNLLCHSHLIIVPFHGHMRILYYQRSLQPISSPLLKGLLSNIFANIFSPQICTSLTIDFQLLILPLNLEEGASTEEEKSEIRNKNKTINAQ